MTIRTRSDILDLKQRAERLARAGAPRTDISRALGVPLATLNRWAFEGGWRRKDLEAEAEAERAAAIARRLAELAARPQTERLAERVAESRPPAVPAWGEGVLEFKSRDPVLPEWPEQQQQQQQQQSYFEADPNPAPHHGPDHGMDDRPWQPPPRPDVPPHYRSTPAGPVPDWAPVLDPGNDEREPEEIALWLAQDLFMRGKLAEAHKSLRFAANWLAISRQVWAVEDARRARRWPDGDSSSSSRTSNDNARRPAGRNAWAG